MQQQLQNLQPPYASTESFRHLLNAQVQQPYETISNTAQQAKDHRLQQMTFGGGNLDSSAPVNPDFSNLSFMAGVSGSPSQNPQANLSSMHTPHQNLSTSQPRTLATSTSTGSHVDPSDQHITSISHLPSSTGAGPL
jgi:hypothetical protein